MAYNVIVCHNDGKIVFTLGSVIIFDYSVLSF